MEFKYDDTGIRAKLDPANVAKAFRAASAEAHVWAIDEEGRFRQERLSGRPGLRRWTGGLARSLQPIFDKTPASTRAGFFFSPKMMGPTGEINNYANIHEEGGIVRPKNGKMLAWPVYQGPATTAGGRARFAGPRQYPGKLFFHESKGKMYFLAESVGKGKGAKLRMVYHLARSVEIPANLGFRTFAGHALRRGSVRVEQSFAASVAAWGAK